jgi:L-asparaginase
MSEVFVISLGGTIASAPAEDTGLAGPRLSAGDLVAAVPGLGDLTKIEVRDLSRLPSCDMTFALARRVTAEIEAAAARGTTGVVVTQGTDTIEEMSFCLDLLVASDIPVAVVGAMRHAALLGADGGANLLAAVRTVLSPTARGLGCLVVLNDEVHAARAVRKTHTTSPAAFLSPGVGPLGWVSEGEVHLRDRPYPRVTLSLPADAEPARPPLVRMTLDDDGWWLPRLREMRAPGVVIEGMGGGHVPGWLFDDIVALASEIPVVLTSRTGGGPVLTSTYGGFKGAEVELVNGGVIPAGTLDGLKARVLLALLLTAGAERDEIVRCVAEVSTLHRGAPPARQN